MSRPPPLHTLAGFATLPGWADARLERIDTARAPQTELAGAPSIGTGAPSAFTGGGPVGAGPLGLPALPNGVLLPGTVPPGAIPPAAPPPGPRPDDDGGSHACRAIFISDLHLGTPGCQAAALLDFLKEHPSEHLYLVGDIVDGWQLRRKWYWPQTHNDVVQKVLRRARKGCKVTFIPGNHDEFARHFVGHSFGGIEVVQEAIHTTADGRRLWVIHGDAFDGVVQCAKWLAYVGDNLYEFTLRINRHLNVLRARMGLPYWSLSAYLKHKVKKALNYVMSFEAAVAAEARSRGFQGVVCGHIHRAEMREIDGTLYCNDGDWVESLSALVEHQDGRLEIVNWPLTPLAASPRNRTQTRASRTPKAQALAQTQLDA